MIATASVYSFRLGLVLFQDSGYLREVVLPYADAEAFRWCPSTAVMGSLDWLKDVVECMQSVQKGSWSPIRQ